MERKEILKEAKRRGFKAGINIERSHFQLYPKHDKHDSHVLKNADIKNNEFTFDYEDDDLMLNGKFIFYNKIWATVVGFNYVKSTDDYQIY